MPTPGPTDERKRHNRVRREQRQIADAAGGIGVPWRAETMLERMERLGEITARQRAAGDEFQRCFRLAQFDPLKAPDMGAARTVAGHRQQAGSEAARRTVYRVFDALGGLGSLAADVVWHVLGFEISLREYEARTKLRREQARGALLAAIGVLARHI